jgi:hypothetical protein
MRSNCCGSHRSKSPESQDLSCSLQMMGGKKKIINGNGSIIV